MGNVPETPQISSCSAHREQTHPRGNSKEWSEIRDVADPDPELCPAPRIPASPHNPRTARISLLTIPALTLWEYPWGRENAPVSKTETFFYGAEMFPFYSSCSPAASWTHHVIHDGLPWERLQEHEKPQSLQNIPKVKRATCSLQGCHEWQSFEMRDRKCRNCGICTVFEQTEVNVNVHLSYIPK